MHRTPVSVTARGRAPVAQLFHRFRTLVQVTGVIAAWSCTPQGPLGGVVLILSPKTVDVAPGGTIAITVRVQVATPTNLVDLTAHLGLGCQGVSATFRRTQLQHDQSTILDIAVGPTGVVGECYIGVSAKRNAGGSSTSVVLTIVSPFSLSGANALVVTSATPGALPITVSRAPTFSQNIQYVITGVPLGMLAGYTLPPSGSDVGTCTVSVDNTVPAGNYAIGLAATYGATTKVHTVDVAVRPSTGADFAIGLNPATLIAAPGSTSPVAVALSRVGPPLGTVELDIPGVQPGVSAVFTPNPAPLDQSAAAFAVSSTVGDGVYSVVVRGRSPGGGVTRMATLTVDVRAPDFSMRASVPAITIAQGSAGSVDLTFNRNATAQGAITLVASSLPTGVSPSFDNPAPVGGTARLTLTVAPGTPALTASPITITATLGSVRQTAVVNLTIPPPPPTSTGSLIANPALLTLAQGSSWAAWLGHTGTETLNLSYSVQPSGAGVGVAFPSSLMPGPVGSAVVIVDAAAALGPYTVTITGRNATVTRTRTLALTVTAVSDFALTLSNPVFWDLDTSYLYNGFVSRAPAFGGTIALSVTGTPSDANPQFFTPTVGPGQIAQLAVRVNAGAPAGLHMFTLSGTSGGLTLTQRVVAVVNKQPTIPGAFGVIPEGAVTLTAAAGSPSSVTASVVIARPVAFGAAPVALSVTGLPNGVSVTAIAPITGTAATITFTGVAGLAAGTFQVDVTAVGGGQTVKAPMVLQVVTP